MWWRRRDECGGRNMAEEDEAKGKEQRGHGEEVMSDFICIVLD